MSPARRDLPPDQADRELISCGGLERTLFVEAGAGTGKTTQLVERIANLVLEREVPLVEIAAITFTEAAAAELQSRIRVHFERRLAAAEDLIGQQRCRDALADLDRAAIATLHGFASRLLGEFAVAAGLPPQIGVADEVSSQLAAEQRWQRFVDALYEDPAHEELLTRAALTGIHVEPRYLGEPSLRDAAARLNENWDLLGVVAAQQPPPLGPIDLTAFDRSVVELDALVATCATTDDKLYERAVGQILPEARHIAALPTERKLQALCELGERWEKNNNKGQKQNWADVSHARDVVAGVGRARREIVQRSVDELLRHFLVLLADHVLHNAAERRAAGTLEFHDLLVLSRSMLRSNGAARRSLHERYRHVLLDEFQDTDPLQIELAVLVATAVAEPGATRWSSLAVDDGRLFFVGDPKQSIYRFRRADISLFLEARDRFGGDGSLARLSANFRSVGPVLDWVNGLFAELMPVEITGAQPGYEPLRAMRRPAGGFDHRPLLLGGPHPDPKVRAGDLRRLEAHDIAATVTDIFTRPEAWPIGEGDGWRPATLSDVTILLPARTSLPYLRDALDAAQVPYRLATGTLVYDTQEVRDVLAVLRCIDDPSDELALVAALRAPLYACSDIDLYRYRRAGGRWDLRVTPPDQLDPASPVPHALAHLHSLWEQRWWRTASELVEQVLADRHAYLLAFGAPRPTDVWRRLRFLADQARAFEEAGGGGVRAFVQWAALQGADGAAVHEPLLPETDEDAVRIMTVHGSKGLEFPITMLSGMTTAAGGWRRGVSVLWNDDGQPELRLTRSLATEFHEPRADLELEMDRHEKLRLLYVAATRARDHLVVSCHHKAPSANARPDANRSYGQLVWEFHADEGTELARRHAVDAEPAVAPADPAAPGPAALAPIDVPEALDTPPRRAAWINERDELLALAAQRTVWSATAVVNEVERRAVLEDDDAAALGDDGAPQLADAAAGSGSASAVPQRRRGRAGTAIGRAVHATLQLLDLTEQPPAHLRAQVDQQCAIEAIDELADTVETFVRAALASDAVRLAAVHTHHKELYLAAPVGARIIEGYIDLLIETPQGLVVVDYKTDGVRTEAEVDAKLDHYELQAATYAAALEHVTGRPVHECRFVFCRASGAIERRVRDLPAAVDRIHQVLGDDRLRNEPSPPSAAPV